MPAVSTLLIVLFGCFSFDLYADTNDEQKNSYSNMEPLHSLSSQASKKQEKRRNSDRKETHYLIYEVEEPVSERKIEVDPDELQKLSALGYLSGYNEAPERKNVTIFDEKKACSGLNLYISGHGPEAILMDMEGNVLHKWTCPVHDILNCDASAVKSPEKYFFRRAEAFDNGDIIAIVMNIGLVKMNWESEILWVFLKDCHHDFHVDDEGKIYVLTRETGIIPEFGDEKIYTEFITVLTSTGKETRKIALWDCFENSFFAPVLRKIETADTSPRLESVELTEIFHTNTLDILDGRHEKTDPIFKKGNALISSRNAHMIAIVDLTDEKVIWGLSDMWRYQHDPDLLDNGNILIFDNEGYEQRTRILEFDPLSQEVVWHYDGGPDKHFYSKFCGSNQRLHNRNTLISDSMNGRALEVTPDKQIVWEFFVPFRLTNDQGRTIIPALFDLIRLPSEFFQNHLGNTEDS